MGKGRRSERDKIRKPKYSNNIDSTKAMVSHLKKASDLHAILDQLYQNHFNAMNLVLL
jgi:hypothetical protein